MAFERAKPDFHTPGFLPQDGFMGFPSAHLDPVHWLPPAAAEKFATLRQNAEDLGAVLANMFNTRNEIQQKLMTENAYLNRIKTEPYDPAHAAYTEQAIAKQQAKVATIKRELERASQLHDERAKKFAPGRAFVRNTEDFLRSAVPAGQMLVPCEYEAKLPKKSSDMFAAIEKQREIIASLRADIHEVRSAIYPSGPVRAVVQAQIERLAEQGRPNVLHMLERNEELGRGVDFRTSYHFAFADKRLVGTTWMPDMLGFMFWAFKDTLTAALMKEIDNLSDDPKALTGEQRTTIIAAKSEEIFAAERLEVALIDRVNASGAEIMYRPDTHPFAVLGLQLAAAPEVNTETSPGYVFEASGWPREARPVAKPVHRPTTSIDDVL